MAFIPPDEADAIRVEEADARYDADLSKVDEGIRGVFTFVPKNLMACEIKEYPGIKYLECKEML